MSSVLDKNKDRLAEMCRSFAVRRLEVFDRQRAVISIPRKATSISSLPSPIRAPALTLTATSILLLPSSGFLVAKSTC